MAIDISHRNERYSRKIVLSPKNAGGLSGSIVKLIAIAAMLIDHIAWAFVPFGSIAGQAMHIVGRITAPVMCFMLAEGYHYTRNVRAYALRLGVFAVISHFAYGYFHWGTLRPFHSTSVIFTLLLGLMALVLKDSQRLSMNAKYGLTLIIALVSMLCDWGGIGVVWIVLFHMYRWDRKMQIKSFCIATAIYIIIDTIFCAFMGRWYNDLFQVGIFLAVPLLMKYNGRRGKYGMKWLFYVLYPAHLALLGIIKYVVLK